MVAEVIDLAVRRRLAGELRESWQAKLLADALIVHNEVARPRDPMGMCVLSIMAHNFDEAMPVLLALFGARGIGRPLLTSAARIAKTGHVMADLEGRSGIAYKNQALFQNTKTMKGAFRRLADRLKLSDKEREEMFAAVRRWVVSDARLDPTMDPNDPDAKRLVH